MRSRSRSNTTGGRLSTEQERIPSWGAGRRPVCRHGINCHWLRQGRCFFFHPRGQLPQPRIAPAGPRRSGATQEARSNKKEKTVMSASRVQQALVEIEKDVKIANLISMVVLGTIDKMVIPKPDIFLRLVEIVNKNGWNLQKSRDGLLEMWKESFGNYSSLKLSSEEQKVIQGKKKAGQAKKKEKQSIKQATRLQFEDRVRCSKEVYDHEVKPVIKDSKGKSIPWRNKNKIMSLLKARGQFITTDGVIGKVDDGSLLQNSGGEKVIKRLVESSLSKLLGGGGVPAPIAPTQMPQLPPIASESLEAGLRNVQSRQRKSLEEYCVRVVQQELERLQGGQQQQPLQQPSGTYQVQQQPGGIQVQLPVQQGGTGAISPCNIRIGTESSGNMHPQVQVNSGSPL